MGPDYFALHPFQGGLGLGGQGRRAGNVSLDGHDDVELGRLRFTHTHYDTSSAEQDPNVVIPLDRLHELVERGRVGSASPVHVGMMGFNPDPTGVADELAPAVAGVLLEAQVDVAILVPG